MYTKASTKKLSVEIADRDAANKSVNIRLSPSYDGDVMGLYSVIHKSFRGSDLCGTVAGMVTPKGSMSTEGEILQVSVLPYRCSICPPLVKRQMSIL